VEENKQDLESLKGSIPNVRWNMMGIRETDVKDIQAALETGYEPFAITTKPIPQKSSLLEGNKSAFSIETILWFKQPVILDYEVKDEQPQIIS
jgi:hypothetical protein